MTQTPFRGFPNMKAPILTVAALAPRVLICVQLKTRRPIAGMGEAVPITAAGLFIAAPAEAFTVVSTVNLLKED
ncbi:MAG: hypothetical protein ABSE73_08235 [Planctomycetota bacterium]